MAETFGNTPSYLCVLQLHDFPPNNGWCDDRHCEVPILPGKSAQILDLRHAWRTDVSAPFDNVHINVTRAAIEGLTDELGHRPVEIDVAPFEVFHDETLWHLGMSLLPAFRKANEINALFAEHVVAAAAVHLATSYGGLAAAALKVRGGLAPWQVRRARETLLDGIDGDIDPHALAQACGLSPRHFAKAFKRTLGQPPHRWLLRARVDRACEMLLHGDERLGTIALACGFADQSHMTRVFTRLIGIAPGAWRRMRRS
jgi:AraC family transcriptional regulator